MKRELLDLEVIEAASTAFSVSMAEMVGYCKKSHLPMARCAAVHLLRVSLDMSYPKIAKAMGRKTHNPAMYQFRSAVRHLCEDTRFIDGHNERSFRACYSQALLRMQEVAHAG